MESGLTTNETNKVSQKAISKLLQKDDCRTYRCNVLHIAYSIIGHENNMKQTPQQTGHSRGWTVMTEGSEGEWVRCSVMISQVRAEE